MSVPVEASPMRPVGRAVEILDAVPAVPLNALPAGPPPVLDAVPATPTVDVLPADPRPPANFMLRALWGLHSAIEWVFGIGVLMVGLAVLAALPILQFLSLGYLLEASGRIARSGRIRDCFVGVRKAARIGGVVLGIWLWLLPVRLVSDLAHSAQIIDPGSRIAAAWRVGLLVLICLTFFHIVTACAVGGRLRHFFWPFNIVMLVIRVFRGGYYTEARDAVWNTLVSLRLPYYFWLGFRGFIGAFAWLALPITMLAISSRGHSGLSSLLGFIGSLMLIFVLMYLPFLQMRLAMTNRLRGAFEWLAVRRDYRRAPWAFTFAFIVTLAFALPLYILKIQVVPSEAAWIPSLVFIMFIYPARMITGWAMGRAETLRKRRPQPRHWFFRWTGRLPFLPAAAFYVLIVFFTQYTSWNGIWSLYEQHAFLVPVPFFGM